MRDGVRRASPPEYVIWMGRARRFNSRKIYGGGQLQRFGFRWTDDFRGNNDVTDVVPVAQRFHPLQGTGSLRRRGRCRNRLHSDGRSRGGFWPWGRWRLSFSSRGTDNGRRRWWRWLSFAAQLFGKSPNVVRTDSPFARHRRRTGSMHRAWCRSLLRGNAVSTGHGRGSGPPL